MRWTWTLWDPTHPEIANRIYMLDKVGEVDLMDYMDKVDLVDMWNKLGIIKKVGMMNPDGQSTLLSPIKPDNP